MKARAVGDTKTTVVGAAKILWEVQEGPESDPVILVLTFPMGGKKVGLVKSLSVSEAEAMSMALMRATGAAQAAGGVTCS